ncbi:hypothetical protein DPMN_166059 [Dreissena polymorpha]|uniref:Uncharacterized protein n=1 Tax=Dreissena polymorpha TaxID=45954 RepID=A0A9D4EXB1_DREPO|nr:hypothetical protein DPMN_166059 [Dreissena polymorpha]
MALLFHTQQHISEKSNIVADNSASLCFIINSRKSYHLRPTHPTTHPSHPKAGRWMRWKASPMSHHQQQEELSFKTNSSNDTPITP